MRLKGKIIVGIILMSLFWFVFFYPQVVPFMINNHVNPLLATAFYEFMFFLTAYLLVILLFGEAHQHSAKIAAALFLAYHIFDAVEPPFILNSDGTWNLMGGSYIISWDYAISNFLTNTFNIVGPTLYYVTNIGAIAIMAILIFLLLKKENQISKVFRQALD